MVIPPTDVSVLPPPILLGTTFAPAFPASPIQRDQALTKLWPPQLADGWTWDPNESI